MAAMGLWWDTNVGFFHFLMKLWHNRLLEYSSQESVGHTIHPSCNRGSIYESLFSVFWFSLGWDGSVSAEVDLGWGGSVRCLLGKFPFWIKLRKFLRATLSVDGQVGETGAWWLKKSAVSNKQRITFLHLGDFIQLSITLDFGIKPQSPAWATSALCMLKISTYKPHKLRRLK